ncbi:MAG: amino acid adenylation domain-containing protein [Planctomycetes bacterium]|nr:amino acid adenylation domain-containing protein [Planctomycetota bacterium]
MTSNEELRLARKSARAGEAVLLAERLEEAARAHADSVALVDGERRITYRELLARADVLAAELQARGLGRNDLVGVALPRSAELVIAIAGIVRAGAAYLPLDLAHPAERRGLILADAKPRVVVTDGGELAGLPAESEALPLPRESSRARTALEQPEPGDLAYVIYTSGSTGRPNGVRVTQHNVTRLFTTSEPIYGFGPQDVWSLFHSIAFDFSVWELWGALLYGGRLVVVPDKVAKATDAFHALVVREGVTVLNQTPSAFRAFDMADAAAGRPPLALRSVIFGGEALDPRTLRAWFDARGDQTPQLVNMYGITETTVHVTWRPMRDADANASGASLIGAPLPDLRIELLDSEGNPVPDGEPGEICVGGEGLADGYLERPKLTATRFRLDPRGEQGERLYHSGDLARRTREGELEYLGRADLQVKLRGYRIELGEIEAALRSAEGVRDAVVALREDPVAGPRLVAYLVLEDGAAIDPNALRAHTAQRVPEYMVPAAYVRIESIPRTVNDKVDRAVLPAPQASDLPGVVGGEAPRDEDERTVAGIFAEVLGTPVATREADFFRLGGHSLLAWRVVVLCQERLAAPLSVNAVFSNPSVAGLAECVRRERQKSRGTQAVVRVPRGVPQALTAQQQALWLEIKLHTGTELYNEPISFRHETRLAPDRVRAALVRLAQKHEILRARLVEPDGVPAFVFDRAASDLSLAVIAGGEPDLQAELLRPLDLQAGPLWRAVLHQDARGGSVLLLVVHHIIFDAASEEILLSDFAAAMNAPEAPLPEGELDFADLAEYERARLASDQPELERFWAKALAGAELTPELPGPLVACPSGEEERAVTRRARLTPELTRAIRELARELGTTPFHIHLAAYLTLLRTWTSTDELVIGSPVSLRETTQARGVVGYLLSPTALRAPLSGGTSFRETVADLVRRWQEVREHARLPIHLVLQAASGGKRSSMGSPFQLFFSLIHDSKLGLSIDGKPLRPHPIALPNAKFKLFLLVEEHEEDASLILEWKRSALDPAMGERMLGQIENLLREATAQPALPLARLPLVGSPELERIRAFSVCERPYQREKTVTELFEEVVRRCGDDTAVVSGATTLTYAELDRRANAVAHALRKAGVRRGDRVPLLVPRGARFIACALGALKCGASFAPLDPGYPSERHARMLDGLGARAALRAPDLPPPVGGLEWIDACCADVGTDEPAPPRESSPTDGAYVMFTSGSTGKPKGVEVPHRGIVRLVQAQDFARMGPEQSWLQISPTSFDLSTLEIWAALLHGGRTVVIEEAVPTPARIAQTIRNNRVNSAWFTAALFNTLVDEAPDTFRGLEQILVGGEALSPVHMKRAFELLPGVRLVNGYGPTENTTFTTCHEILRADIATGGSIPIGRPIANTTVYVLDRDGRPAPIGVSGELVTGGDGVALGYAGQPEKTAERFVPDTFCGTPGATMYRTGDRVRWREDGVLEFFGRFDEQLKIRGHRIEPGEIAACLSEHAGVLQAVVVPRRTDAGATVLYAYVVAQGSVRADELPRVLAAHLAQRLPAYMLPAAIMPVPALPLKLNGKLDVQALPLPSHAAARPAGSEAKLSGAEAKLLKIWREALKNRSLGLDDDFFDAGGDSLLAVRMLVRVERELGTTIPVRAVVEGRTVRRIAKMLTSGSEPVLPRGFVIVREGESARPIFCLPGLGGISLQFETLSAKLRTQRTVYAIELHELEIERSVLQSLPQTAAQIARQLREIQPNGPYSLLGYSYGGNLAVEIARELVQQGLEVEHVAILDAYAPGSVRDPSGLDKVRRHLRILGRLRWSEAYEYVSSRVLRRVGLRGPEPQAPKPVPESELARRLAQTEELGMVAFHSYRPTPFAGRIVLVHATDLEDWMEIADSSGTSGWGAVCEGGVELIKIGCRHLEMFKEPNITELAQRLEEVLESRPRA